MSRSSKSFATGTVVIAILLIIGGLVINELTVAWAIRPGARLQNPSLRVLLALFQLAMLGTGVLLLIVRPRIGGREILASAVGLALMVLAVEFVMRTFVFGDRFDGTLDITDGIGWTPRPNVASRLDLDHFGTVTYATDERGFRRFDAAAADETRIFVIGDSFTHAYHVTRGDSYFDEIAERIPNAAIYAFGAGGYGSLQEYMILDRYLDEVQPDVILWQFTSNDLSNNYLPLEQVTLENGNQQWRPFLIDGRVEYRYPARWQFIGHSYLLRYLAMQYKLFRIARRGEVSVEYSFTPDHPLYRGAVETTSEILSLVRRRAGDVPIVAFSVDRPVWLGDTFEQLAARNGMQFVEGIPEAVEEARRRGVRVDARPYDGHWTREGHAIAGQMLAAYLTKSGLVRGGRRDAARIASEVATRPAAPPTAPSPRAASHE